MICSDDCRKAAAQCVNLGKRAGAGKQRGILFDMARAWEALAKHALRLERLKGSDAEAVAAAAGEMVPQEVVRPPA